MTSGAYSRLDRAVHGLALGSRTVQRMSFDMESHFAGVGGEPACGGAVFITGLARSGTTTLLRILYQTGEFESLTYRDMPFVLMPRLWARVTQPLYKKNVATERAHGDSVLVDFDSPEGFESVFWRAFSGGAYEADNCLRQHDPDDGVLEKFRTYVSMIASRSAVEPPGAQRRYLSKNNNNLIRLSAIRRTLPDAGILLLYRDPLQTAASSLRQHIRFCDQQIRDPFVLKYMNWLEHYEFGLGHKPFRFGAGASPEPTPMEPAPMEPDYWLHYWTGVYEYLLGTDTRFCLVNYENLCAMPQRALGEIFRRLEMRSNAPDYAPMLRAAHTTALPPFNGQAADRARAIHERLCADPRNLFCLD